MRVRTGTVVTAVACLVFLALLVWPYVVRPAGAVTTYYRGGLLSPLIAGALVLAILATIGAGWTGLLSSQLGAGAVLGIGLFVVAIAGTWAVTARLDVFQASGWALPAQRFVLVGAAVAILAGAAWDARRDGLLASTGARTTG